MSARQRQTRPNSNKIVPSTLKLRSTVRERPSSPATVTPSQLLQSLVNPSETTGATVKSLGILLHTLNGEDAHRTAMKAVNATSSAIAAVHKSGWLYTPAGDKYATENVDHTVFAAKLALSFLRDRDGSPGTERAALGLVGRLMAIKAWNGAWELIPGVKAGILKLYPAAPDSDSVEDVLQDDLHFLKLSLPTKPSVIDSEITIIITTYLSYAFQVLLHRPSGHSHQNDQFYRLAQIISADGGGDGLFLSWAMSLPRTSSRKQLYPLSTSLLKTSELISQTLEPEPSMIVRCYAIRCVLLVSSSEDATWIWKQVRNVAASYVKALSPDIIRSFAPLHNSLVACVESARLREDQALFKDSSFETFYQQWIEIALKANDQRALDYVQSLLPQAPGTLRTQKAGSIQHTIQKLPGLWAAIEEAVAGKNVNQAETQLHLMHKEIAVVALEESQDFVSNATKLFQATERLRRRVRAASDDDPVGKFTFRFQQLFAVIIKLYLNLLKRGRLQQTTRLEIVSASLETLIALSKGAFRAQKPETYDDAYQHLEVASALVQDFYAEYDVNLGKERTLDLWRCLCGAFWNLGSVLYKAGRWDNSVPFISKSVEIDKLLLVAAWDALQVKNQTWTVFFEQMPKRAMLLANCFIKMSNRQRAYELYRDALSCCLRTSAAELEEQGLNVPSSAVFSAPRYLFIVTTVERITYIGALELFLGQEINLGSFAASRGRSPVLCGALIEQQIRSLERSFWKPEVRPIIMHLLQDAADVYSTSHPLRQARVLCTHLEYAYYNKCNWKDVQRLGHIAVRLLENKDLKLDAPLSQYRPQYLISAYLWMVFHSHSNRDHESISSFAYKARDVLGASIAPGLVTSPEKGVTKQQTSNQKVGKETKPVARVAGSSSRKTQVPRPKKGEAALSSKASSVPKKQNSSTTVSVAPTLINFDCPDAFWLQIEMSLNLFSALGLVQLKLIYLNICCIFLKTRDGTLERDLYAKLLIEFANECSKLGRIRIANEAFELSLQLINKNAINDQTNLLFLLRFASFLSTSGNTRKGLELYAEATKLSRNMEWDLQNGTTIERTRSRVQRYALTALACSTYSTIQVEKDDSVAASRGYLQAVRIWNAAIDVTQRLDPRPAPKSAERNPFDMGNLISALPEAEFPQESKQDNRTRFVQRPGPEGWHLVLARELLEAQTRISEHYLNKGNHREAEYFILQCRTLSEALGAPAYLLRSICLQTDLQIRLWNTDSSQKHLKEAQVLAQSSGLSFTAEVSRLEGQYYEQIGEISEAKTCFINGQAQLWQYGRDLDLSAAQTRSDFSDPKKEDFTFPSLLASLLGRQAWLCRDEEYALLLDHIENLPAIGDIKVQEKVLMARLANHIASRQLSQEASLSSLAESVISVPLGVVGNADMERTHSQQGLLDLLESVEKYCWSVLNDLRNRGSVAQYREMILILVSSIATKTNLGHKPDTDADMPVALLDWAAAETLRRELLESIEQKLQRKGADDMEWPIVTSADPRVSESSTRVPTSGLSLFGDPEESDRAEAALRAYWVAVRERHKDISLKKAVEFSEIDRLPDNWVVINIGISTKEDSLFISRNRRNQRSLMFCIPLRRSNRNESDPANGLTISTAIAEMNDIVESSRQSGKRAREVAAKGRGARAEWWSERAALDQRLCDLLDNIEFCWLGAFKTILAPQRVVKEEDLSSIHDKFRNFFAKITQKNEKKGPSPACLDKVLVECFSSLAPTARDEELEDFIYFFLDSYQCTGHRVFLSDLDIDEAVLELRSALKEIYLMLKCSDSVEDEHTFLVLDKRLQGLPWESIPVLRGRPVSRIPSISFLLDRLDLAYVSGKSLRTAKGYALDRVLIDPTKVFYLLNPEGDLKRTEETFAPWLKSMNKVGWAGIVGRRPANFELNDVLNRRDLFIYFGHGGAEQYIRGQQIRSSLRCPSTMLWGCSSGAMDEAGDFDRSGTPYNYLLGGCPSLVVNLWDVTDRDIDKFAQSVFNKLKLEPEVVKARKQGKGSLTGISVVQAVAESREVCKLKYLTGAAPVVYGIPFYI